MKNNRLISIFRVLYGLFYTAVGATWLILSALGKPWPEPHETQAAAAFTSALAASGYINPLIAVASFLGGLLTVFYRTAPLGVVILSPLVISIFLFHVLLNDNWPDGVIQLACLVAFAWLQRDAYHSMWRQGISSAT